LACAEARDAGYLPSAEDFVLHAAEREPAALAEGQVVGVIDNDVVGADEIGIAPIEPRIEGIGGSGDSNAAGERLIELILGLEGKAGRDAADHAKLSPGEEELARSCN
jgi:hypothetical protein